MNRIQRKKADIVMRIEDFLASFNKRNQILKKKVEIIMRIKEFLGFFELEKPGHKYLEFSYLKNLSQSFLDQEEPDLARRTWRIANQKVMT